MNQFWRSPPLLGSWWSCWSNFSSILGIHLEEMIHLKSMAIDVRFKTTNNARRWKYNYRGLEPCHSSYGVCHKLVLWSIHVLFCWIVLNVLSLLYFILFRASIYACTSHSSGLPRTNNLSWVTHIVSNYCINHIELL